MAAAVAAAARSVAKKVKRAPLPSKQAIQLTDAAATRIRDLLQQRGKEYLKIGVKSRGCSGLSYTMSYAESPPGRFEEVVEEKGVKVIVEPKALMHLLGTTVDYVEERLKSEFVFVNPNAKGSCGCGESFMT